MKTTPSTSSSAVQRELSLLQTLAQKTSDPLQLESYHRLVVAKEALLRQNTPSTSEKVYTASPTAPLLSDEIRAKIEKIKQRSSFDTTYQPKDSATSSIAPLPPKIQHQSSSTATTYQSNYSMTRGITSTTPLPQMKNMTTIAPRLAPPIEAVGFGNNSNNCWCNSLLHMVIHVPSLRKAYEAVANDCIANGFTAEEQQPGNALLQALSTYQSCLAKHVAIPPSVSQTVRLALHCFFPDDINPSAARQEDAHEAMQLIMGRYERILKEQGLPLAQPPYIPIETKKIYEPQGNPRPADPNKLEKDAYTRLSPDFSTSLINHEYQLILRLQDSSSPTFSQLLRTYFDTRDGGSGQSPLYLRPNDDQIEDFKLKQEIQQFQAIPQELVLIIGRFGCDPVTQRRFKIMTPIAIPRSFTLPQEATTTGLEPIYDLNVFILHRGDANGGHYIAYRRLNDGWIECNDASVRRVSEQEIDQILHNKPGSRATSYIHHYTLRSQPAIANTPTLIPSSSSSSAARALPPLPSTDITSLPAPIKQEPAAKALIPVQEEPTNLIAAKQSLEELNQLIQKRSALNAIKRQIATLPQDLIDTLKFLIWVNDKAHAGAPTYGAAMLQSTPRRLANITLPWVSLQGSNIIEQLIALYDMKIRNDKDAVENESLIAFLSLLKTREVTDRQLNLIFDQLSISPELKEQLLAKIPGGKEKFKNNPRLLQKAIQLFLLDEGIL